MNIFFILFYFFIFVECKYNYKKTVNTKLKDKNKIMLYFSSKKFLDNYLNSVNASEIVFKPKVVTKLIKYPQVFTYKSKPVYNCIPDILPRLNIKQTWQKKEDTYMGNIHTNLIEVALNLTISKINNLVTISINSEIVNKKFFIPNILLNCAIDDFIKLVTNQFYRQCV